MLSKIARSYPIFFLSFIVLQMYCALHLFFAHNATHFTDLQDVTILVSSY